MHDDPVQGLINTRAAAGFPLTSQAAGGALTVLGFDFGQRYVGVAVGDTETGLAHALEFIDAEAGALRFARIAALISEWRPVRLLVGLPLSLEGKEHEVSRRARRFARQLQSRFGLPVELADERLSSVAAEDILRERGRGGRSHKHESHALAAQLVLQAWLDQRARKVRS